MHRIAPCVKTMENRGTQLFKYAKLRKPMAKPKNDVVGSGIKDTTARKGRCGIRSRTLDSETRIRDRRSVEIGNEQQGPTKRNLSNEEIRNFV